MMLQRAVTSVDTAAVARAVLRGLTAAGAATVQRHGDSLYISVLEKANQQLALSSNPYGFLVSVMAVLVGVLAVLFTIMAIIAAVVVYRQGAEPREAVKKYGEAFEAQVATFRALVDDLIKSGEATMSAQADEVKAQVDALKHEMAGANESERAELNRKLESLESQQRTLATERSAREYARDATAAVYVDTVQKSKTLWDSWQPRVSRLPLLLDIEGGYEEIKRFQEAVAIVAPLAQVDVLPGGAMRISIPDEDFKNVQKIADRSGVKLRYYAQRADRA